MCALTKEGTTLKIPRKHRWGAPRGGNYQRIGLRKSGAMEKYYDNDLLTEPQGDIKRPHPDEICAIT